MASGTRGDGIACGWERINVGRSADYGRSSDPAAFAVERATPPAIVLDDLITAQIVESGTFGAAFDQVSTLVADGLAFTVRWNAERRSTELVPSDSLLEVCPLELASSASQGNLFPSSCVLRREISPGGVMRETSAQVTESDQVSGLVQRLLNHDGDQDQSRDASQITAAYTAQLNSVYSLNARHSHAFLIHPGYAWPTASGSTSTFVLSPRIVALALLRYQVAPASPPVSCLEAARGIKCLRLRHGAGVEQPKAEAERICKAEGGRLAWIADDDEHALVTNMIRMQDGNKLKVWVDHDGFDTVGEWRLSAMELDDTVIAVNQQFVRYGNPRFWNATAVRRPGEQCSSLGSHRSSWVSSSPCSRQRPFVCSYFIPVGLASLPENCAPAGSKLLWFAAETSPQTLTAASDVCATVHNGTLAVLDTRENATRMLTTVKTLPNSQILFDGGFWVSFDVSVSDQSSWAQQGSYVALSDLKGETTRILWQADFSGSGTMAGDGMSPTKLGSVMSATAEELPGPSAYACSYEWDIRSKVSEEALWIGSDDEALQLERTRVFGVSVKYDQQDSVSVLAQLADVDLSRVEAWKVERRLTATEACMSGGQLRTMVRTEFLTALQEGGRDGEVNDLQITSVNVIGSSVQCDRRVGKRRADSYVATGEFETVVVSDGSGASVNLDSLETTISAVTSVEKIGAESRGGGLLPSYTDDEDGNKGLDTPVVAGIAAGAGVLVVCVGGLVVWRRRNSAQHASAVDRVDKALGADMVTSLGGPTIDTEELDIISEIGHARRSTGQFTGPQSNPMSRGSLAGNSPAPRSISTNPYSRKSVLEGENDLVNQLALNNRNSLSEEQLAAVRQAGQRRISHMSGFGIDSRKVSALSAGDLAAVQMAAARRESRGLQPQIAE